MANVELLKNVLLAVVENAVGRLLLFYVRELSNLIIVSSFIKYSEIWGATYSFSFCNG